LESLGLSSARANDRARSVTRKRTRSESRMDMDDSRQRSSSRMASRDRSVMGLKDGQKKIVTSITQKKQRISNLMAKRGEADREILVKKPRHLFSGKRGMGKTDRR